MKPSILQRLSETIEQLPSFGWSKSQALTDIPATTPPMPAVVSPRSDVGTALTDKQQEAAFREDITAFANAVQPAIDSGVLTFENVHALLDERKAQAYAQYGPILRQSVEAVKTRVERTSQVLAPDQREHYLANVDRDALLSIEFRNGMRQHQRQTISAIASGPADQYTQKELATIAGLMPGYDPYEPIWTVQAVATVLGDERTMALANTMERRNQHMFDEQLPNGVSRVQSWLGQLAVTYASKSPSNLHRLVERHLQDSAQSRFQMFPLDELFFEQLSLRQQYPNNEKSLALYNALSSITVDAPTSALVHWRVVAQLEPDDLRGYKNQHVLRYTAQHVIGHSQRPPMETTIELERILSIAPGQKPAKPISYKSLEEAFSVERLANILLHTYTVDAIAPILEAYQGHRALDGSLRPEQLLTDVHAYLKTYVAASPELLESSTYPALHSPITYGYTTSG